jgi:hypothetical protein
LFGFSRASEKSVARRHVIAIDLCRFCTTRDLLHCGGPPAAVGAGRGSVKEGASRDPKYDYGEDEELHVLITGERQDDVSPGGMRGTEAGVG